MPIEVTMPQLSDTMSEGTILTWRKKEGDKVTRGEALAEVATDKADLEIESFHEGTLLKINSPAGEKVKVGSVIAIIGEAGESVGQSAAATNSNATPVQTPSQSAVSPVQPPSQSAPPSPSSPPTSSPAQRATAAPVTSTPPPEELQPANDRIKISPLARNVAESHGIDYSTVHGSGEGGRIVRRDIELVMEQAPQSSVVQQRGVSQQRNVAPQPQIAPAAPVQQSPAAARPDSVTPTAASANASSTQLSSMRATIASRMVESVTTIPHFYVTSKIVMDEVKRLKASLKDLPQYEGLTYTHIIVRAAALALRKFPTINSSFQNNQIVQPGDVNVGIVTAVTGGLLIPVVKRADQLSLADIVAEARAMIQRARAGKPRGDDLMGGTFSISNMGMHAVESFTAIINPGQGAILAISAIDDEPIAVEGEMKIASVMRATLSVDHRIIDGVMAGEFITELRRLLHDPVLLLA